VKRFSPKHSILSERQEFIVLGRYFAAVPSSFAFELNENLEPVLRLIEKYRDVPMSLADACLVRMSETLADLVILTTDEGFRIYRRHSRQTVPCVTPE